MSKWKEVYSPELGACIDVDGALYNSNFNLAALSLIDVHNADIAALEARIAELQRRLDAVLSKLDNPYWVGLPYEPTICAVRQIAAQCHDIAEGRE